MLEVIAAMGPHVGLPTLRSLFPDVSRAELLDLQRSYRGLYREQNRLLMNQLTWTMPGRVWAMDHADPPAAIDGTCDVIFAVRDLASGMQLAWDAALDATAEATLTPLESLFRHHGAPLVLKSDNGSAFISERTRRLLDQYGVVHLFSPPALPSYNGSCEAGIGSMKTRTAHHAGLLGFPEQWTSDDLEAGRRQANEVHRKKHDAPTAAERWNQRTTIDVTERQTFRDAIDRYRVARIASLMQKNSCTTANEAATIERIAIRQALVELGMLTLKRRSITPPIKTNNLAKIP